MSSVPPRKSPLLVALCTSITKNKLSTLSSSIKILVSLFVSPPLLHPSHYVIAVNLVLDLVGDGEAFLVLVLLVLVLLVASSASYDAGLFYLVDDTWHFVVISLSLWFDVWRAKLGSDLGLVMGWSLVEVSAQMEEANSKPTKERKERGRGEREGDGGERNRGGLQRVGKGREER